MSIRRDYKPDSTWKHRRQVRLHGVLVIALVLIGGFASLLVYVRGNQHEVAVTSQPATDNTPEARDAEPAPILPKPKYDFYNVLPGRQVIIPEDEVTPRPARNSNTPSLPPGPATGIPAPATDATRYIVQAGSFRQYADADRLKAELALLGIEARIEVGTGADHRNWHRVRIGPFKDSKQVQTLRQRLQENNISSIAIKTR